MKRIKRIIYKLNPFKRKKRGYFMSKLYRTFVTYDSFNSQSSELREDIRELRGLVNQLAAKSKLRPLNGVLMSEKDYKEAIDGISRYPDLICRG